VVLARWRIGPINSGMEKPVDVVIVGAGPAGCTLAAMLAMRGIGVVVFDDDRRPDLLVGESLLPTVVLLMRKLGIEERVREFSQHKPGVSFLHRSGGRLDFLFPAKALGTMPNYAYNVPRPQFDNLLRIRAEELGAVFVARRAEIEMAPEGSGREIQLSAASLALVPGVRHPKLLVDATGRARVFARGLGIPARSGKRNDLALFAHYENFRSGGDIDGQVVISTLTRGWSWRIPLPGRMSVGVVIDKDAAKAHGATAEEKLESIIASERLLCEDGAGRRRLTDVMSYTNYQLVSERGHGPGWVMTGDAYGFVDPMLSPGLFMAMQSADMLDRHVFARGAGVLDDARAMARGCARVFGELRDWHAAWSELIEYFYDGRMYSLDEGGKQIRETKGAWMPQTWMERHLTKHITGMVSGARTRSRYGRSLLKFTTDHLMSDVSPPEAYAIR